MVVLHDRPSGRVIARRRGARHSKGKALANPPIRGAYTPHPARPNGAPSSAGCSLHNDSGHICALKAQIVQHDRPRATDVARPRDPDVPIRTALADQSPRAPIAECLAFASGAASSAGRLEHADLGPEWALQAQGSHTTRPRAGGVAQPRDVDVPIRTVTADQSPRVSLLECPAFAHAATSSVSRFDMMIQGPVCAHRVHDVHTVRPWASVVPRVQPPSGSRAMPHTLAMPALRPHATAPFPWRILPCCSRAPCLQVSAAVILIIVWSRRRRRRRR